MKFHFSKVCWIAHCVHLELSGYSSPSFKNFRKLDKKTGQLGTIHLLGVILRHFSIEKPQIARPKKRTI